MQSKSRLEKLTRLKSNGLNNKGMQISFVWLLKYSYQSIPIICQLTPVNINRETSKIIFFKCSIRRNKLRRKLDVYRLLTPCFYRSFALTSYC